MSILIFNVSVCENMKKTEWAVRTEKQIPIMKQTERGRGKDRGEQRQRDPRKKDSGGGEKRLDIWLLKFNKTLKERNGYKNRSDRKGK